ncbi:hypothetical protein Mapa_000046 [Marchantia paleacea]|nr:hypothetical protein Mapa_000046 [Marchantia paleacea]
MFWCACAGHSANGLTLLLPHAHAFHIGKRPGDVGWTHHWPVYIINEGIVCPRN